LNDKNNRRIHAHETECAVQCGKYATQMLNKLQALLNVLMDTPSL
jgi:hypothetical protein